MGEPRTPDQAAEKLVTVCDVSDTVGGVVHDLRLNDWGDHVGGVYFEVRDRADAEGYRDRVRRAIAAAIREAVAAEREACAATVAGRISDYCLTRPHACAMHCEMYGCGTLRGLADEIRKRGEAGHAEVG